MTRAWFWVVAAALACFSGATADDKPSGTVTIESKFTLAGEGIEVKLK